jgi:hypothetical protein
MAARTDVILDLRQGYTPAEIAKRHDCSLPWVEIIAGVRTPESAFSRQRAAGQHTGRVVPFHMPMVTSNIAPPVLWRIPSPMGRMYRAAA